MTDERREADRDELLLAVLSRLDAGEDEGRVLGDLPVEARDTVRAEFDRIQAVRAALRPISREVELSGFEVEAEVARGSSGTVLRAIDRRLERRVALKLLHRPSTEALIHEARQLARLDHPAIVRVHSVLEREDRAALVLEWVDGPTLEEVAGEIGPRRALRLLEAIASGLAAAHAAGIVHRDLKPANVRIARGSCPKILDFGLATPVGVPGLRRFTGTPLYASPEQVRGDSVGPASDVFSFGALAHRLLTGVDAFDAPNVEGVLRRVQESEVAPLRDLDERVSVGLQAVVLSCLEKDPALRPAAATVAAELRRLRAGDTTRLRPPSLRQRLEHSVRQQWDEVQSFERQGLLAPTEADPLRVVWRRLLADQDAWVLDARRISLPQVVMSAGVWSVVVATTLFVWLGRSSVEGPWRIGGPLLAFASLLLPGIWFRIRRDFDAAAVFLSGAVLTAFPVLTHVLVERSWFALDPAETTALLPETASNTQLLVASAATLLLSAVVWSRVRFTALAFTTATLCTSTYFALLLRAGWLDRALDDRALLLLPLVLLVLPALAFESAGRPRWAVPFHGVALVALVLGLDVLALEGTTLERLGVLRSEFWDEDRLQSASVALNGVLFLVLLLAFERARSLDLRRGARLLQWLVPLHLLGALYVNANRPEPTMGDAATYCGAVLLSLVLGAYRDRRRLLFAAGIGFALAPHLLVTKELVPLLPFLVGLAVVGLSAALWMRRRLAR